MTVENATGTRLLDAVAVMDRLRSPGGCPWDAAQTHESLRRYLVEETYELLETLDDGDRDAMLEELGDVLLQVLFHARLATEHTTHPFDIDDVAEALVRKLVGRHPHVFEADDPAVHDVATQEKRWEERKHAEKRRESITDGVAFGQPAVALAGKLVSRARRAGFPPELLPDDPLFCAVAERKALGADPEGELRTTARKFADDLRAAERAARDDGMDPRDLDAVTWGKYFGRT